MGTVEYRFCNSLQKVIENYSEIVDGYVCSSHNNIYGIRKGSASYSTSGTTVPPSLIPVSLCGEWSVGMVFDVYFDFGKCGDNYLDRILFSLDTNATNFGNFFVKPQNAAISKKLYVQIFLIRKVAFHIFFSKYKRTR